MTKCKAGAAGLMQYWGILREMRALLCVWMERRGRDGAHVWFATDQRLQVWKVARAHFHGVMW